MYEEPEIEEAEDTTQHPPRRKSLFTMSRSDVLSHALAIQEEYAQIGRAHV